MHPVAIITGAASGIGLAPTQLLTRRGLRVVATGGDVERLRQARTGFAPGANAEALPLDVTDADVEAIVAEVAARHDRLHYLFNNAGAGNRMDLRDATLSTSGLVSLADADGSRHHQVRRRRPPAHPAPGGGPARRPRLRGLPGPGVDRPPGHAWLYRLRPGLLKKHFDALRREVLPP